MSVKEDIAPFQPLFRDPPVAPASRDDVSKASLARQMRLRYEHLPEASHVMVEAVLKGFQPLEAIPSLPSRAIHVYLCSTYTDMEQEKAVLIRQTYPKLKAYCRERYGVDFHVIDPKWGVRYRPRDDQATLDLCVKEIQRCQRTIGPDFVALVGEKYDVIDLPSSIVFDVFEPIRAALRPNHDDATMDFLDAWYRKDSNAVPTQFVLQPISDVLGDDDSPWPAAERRLHQLLVEGTNTCAEQGVVSYEYLEYLTSSITEKEFTDGTLALSSRLHLQENIMCVQRDISDLTHKLDRSQVKNFVDLELNSNELEVEKYRQQTALQYQKFMPYVNNAHVLKYDVSWSDPHGIDATEHKSYLEKMAIDFYNRFRTMIDAKMAKHDPGLDDELYTEVLRHWNAVKTRCDGFISREEALDILADYILDDTDQPFVLSGVRGIGKSCVLAKVASDVASYLQADGMSVLPSVAVRFCGTTSDSRELRHLLHSLCHQLAFATHKPRHELPTDFRLLKTWFRQFLEQGNFPGIVVVILDGLDLISPAEHAHRLDWLPAKLARNVKVIISCTCDSHVMTKLCSKITNERYHHELPHLSQSDCAELLSNALTSRGRIINFVQWRLAKEMLGQNASPLYTDVLFEEAVKWRAYDVIQRDELTSTIKDSLQVFLARLETKHGHMIVSRALGYITASRDGISEAELDDVMSLDDTLLNEVYQTWDRSVRRIPPVLFSRIHAEISGFLAVKDVDETTVLCWRHQAFADVAAERYLSDVTVAREIHSNLADLYLGTWSRQTQKPFVYSEQLARKLRLRSRDSSAVRHVPEQPLVYDMCSSAPRYNRRKMNQLAYHLLSADRHDDLDREVYFNYTWLVTKLKATSMRHLLADYNLSESRREVALVAEALRMSEAALAEDPDVLCLEIAARLLPFFRQYANIRRLLVKCDTEAMQRCLIVPNWQAFSAPGGLMQYACVTPNNIQTRDDVNVIQSPDGGAILTAKSVSKSQTLLYDVIKGEPMTAVQLPAATQLYPTPDGVYVNVFKGSNVLQTYKVDSRELYGEVQFDAGRVRQVVVTQRYAAFTFNQSVGPVLINTEAKLLLHKFQYQARSVAISNDQRFLVTNNNRCLAIHALPMLERKCVAEVAHAPEKIVFGSDSTLFYVMDSGCELKSVRVNLVMRKAAVSEIVRDLEMRDFVLSHSSRLLLVRASRSLYVFNTHKETLNYRIKVMPPGAIVDALSTFVDAAFTPNDAHVIAARHIYVGVWCARTGRAVRLLHSVVSSVTKMLTFKHVKKAVTLLQNKTMQVWNFDNLDSDVRLHDSLIDGEIVHLATSQHAQRVVGCGAVHAEARVLDLKTNLCLQTLEHSAEIGQTLADVIVSPRGQYVVTRMAAGAAGAGNAVDSPTTWPLLKDDKLWLADTGHMTLHVTNNRFVGFSPTDDKVVFFQCVNYNVYDWSTITYSLLVCDLESGRQGKPERVALPVGDVIGEPLITGSGQFLCMIMQLKDKTVMGTKSSAVRRQASHHSQLQDPSATSPPAMEIVLVVYSFEKFWRGLKFLQLSDIWAHFSEDDRLLDVRLFHEETLLLTYAARCKLFEHAQDGQIDRNRLVPKSAIQYDVRQDNVVKRYDNFLSTTSRVDQLRQSSNSSYVMDNQGQVFSTIDNEMINKLDITVATAGACTFVLDGKYVAMLVKDGRELIILRAKDGVRKARIFTHGVGTHLLNVYDDRTLAIGCADGRIMTFTVLLDSSDPMREIVSLLPSRQLSGLNPTQNDSDAHNSLLATDIRRIGITANLQVRLSKLTRAEIAEKKQKNGVYKAVETEVALIQEVRKVQQTSVACCIQ